jgi:hypothetical protein
VKQTSVTKYHSIKNLEDSSQVIVQARKLEIHVVDQSVSRIIFQRATDALHDSIVLEHRGVETTCEVG